MHLKEHLNTDRDLYFDFANFSEKNYMLLLNNARLRKGTNGCRTEHYFERCHSTALV